MDSPITVGTTAIVAVPTNNNRVSIRFQNVGATTLYFAKSNDEVSSTNFDFMLMAPTGSEVNEAFIEIESVAKYYVVSSAAGGKLARLEVVRKLV